jgi:hypothetical protein
MVKNKEKETNLKEASEFTKEEIERLENEISNMSQLDMAKRWRFSSLGNPMFRCDLPLSEKFQKRFKELGGFTPEISKAIEW